jgi:hypothetical protein
METNYVTEISISEFVPFSNTSHGISVTNGGRNNWTSVNSVNNGGSGIVFNSIRSGGFYAGVGSSNTADGFNITSCSDISFTSFNTNANGGQGVECVSGNNSLSFIDMSSFGNTSDGIKKKVKSVKLDNVIENEQIKKIDFIYITVNGSEHKVLEGLSNNIKKVSKILIVSQYINKSFDQSVQFLKENNFTVEIISKTNIYGENKFS